MIGTGHRSTWELGGEVHPALSMLPRTMTQPSARTSLLTASLAGLLSLACTAPHAAKHSEACVPHPHWAYEGEAGPEHWGTLDPAFFAAKEGVAQSPIDLQTARAFEARLPALQFTSAPVPLEVLNNGHTVQVNCAPGNSLRFGDQSYGLAQFHFHSPSEHTLDGEHAPLEMHMVHKDANGHLAVVGVLIRQGSANGNFDALWQNLPVEEAAAHTVAGASIDPGALLPAERGYFWYDGSLTTPPCSEGVRWFVLQRPLEMSAEQLAKFQQIFNGNNRPVQPLNARLVLRAP